MADPSLPPPRGLDAYLHKTQRPLYSLWFILPLMLLAHVGGARWGQVLWAPHYLERVLAFFGATGAYLPALAIVAVLFMQHLFRRDPLECRLHVLAGMAAESALWTTPLLAMRMLGTWMLCLSVGDADGMLHSMGRKVAAGIYEEFVFRLLLFALVGLIFVDVMELKKALVLPVTVLVSATLFALAHFSGQGVFSLTAIPWGEFAFYAAAGAFLGCVFLLRGFGVAVGAHSLYNLFVYFAAR